MSGDFLYDKVTLPERSPDAPALHTFNGMIYLAWSGVDNNQLNLIRSPTSGELRFQDKVTLRDTSNHAPALTVFQNRLYLCWTGTDRRLNVMSSADGRTFENKITLGETSPAAPAAVVFLDRLYLAWAGVGNDQLNIIQSDNGTNFVNKVTLNQTSTQAPSLATLTMWKYGILYLGWTGTDEEHHLNVITSQDGTTFGNVTMLDDRSSAGPSLLRGPHKTIWIAWTGVGNQQINFLDYGTGAKITLNETSIAAPSAIPALVAWTGTDNNHSLNVARIQPSIPTAAMSSDWD